MSGSVCSYPIAAMKSEAEQVKLLAGVNDEHGGVIVEIEEHMEPGEFRSALKASILNWRWQGIKGVWIKLATELVNLVEHAIEEGFWYHHAEPKYLMLVYWIPESPNMLPANASHRVSIGAFVMNEEREVLVVQEKIGKLQGTGIWKLPTGVLDEGEDISAAAVREVKEETGIDADFLEVLAFRQSHKAFFEKSDIMFLCMLRPYSFNIQKQESEIEAAQWMPLEEFTAQAYVEKHEHVKYIIQICLGKTAGRYSGFSAMPTTTSFSDTTTFFYFNDQDSMIA